MEISERKSKTSAKRQQDTSWHLGFEFNFIYIASVTIDLAFTGRNPERDLAPEGRPSGWVNQEQRNEMRVEREKGEQEHIHT